MPFTPRTRAGFLAGACLLLVHTACNSSSPTTASYYLSAPLVAPGGGSAHGRAEVHLSTLMRSLYVEVYGLAPNAGHSIAIDGEPVAIFVTEPDGSSNAQRGVDAGADPRGRRVSILDANGVEVLVLADASHPQYAEIQDAPLAAFAAGGGHTSLTQIGGTRSLVVRLQGVTPGAYDVFADGVQIGALDAAQGAAKTVVDASNVADDAAIEVQQDGVGLFAGSPRAQIFGLDWCATGSSQQVFVATGPGLAQAALQTYVDCGRRLHVAMRWVPEGDYDLLVGGVAVGVIAVGTDENGESIGEIYFDSDERGDLQLDFEPIGAPLEIRSGGLTHFRIDSFQP
jgi:hypothetical protein